jgi:hypothetical protein
MIRGILTNIIKISPLYTVFYLFLKYTLRDCPQELRVAVSSGRRAVTFKQ